MTARVAPRHALLVRLLSAEQREAIEQHVHRTRTSPSETPTAGLRRVLLAAAGRSDLDRAVEPASERARRGGLAKRDTLIASLAASRELVAAAHELAKRDVFRSAT